MPESVTPLIAVGVVIVLFIVLLSVLTNNYSLNGIKSKTVGDGQHGTAKWATTQEIKKSYASVPFDVASWREGKNLPEVQGLILGSTQRGKQLDALVDRDDVHCLMIGASGVGKTAFFCIPIWNLPAPAAWAIWRLIRRGIWQEITVRLRKSTMVTTFL